MKKILILLAFIFAAVKTTFLEAETDDDQYNWKSGNIFFPSSEMPFQFYIRAPHQPGTYPIVIFLTAFGGFIPGTYYSDFLIDMVDQDVIVASMSTESFANYGKETKIANMQVMFDWINANLTGEFTQNAPGVIPDLIENPYLMAHSAAGPITTMYLNHTCGNIKGHIVMDPCDSFKDPFTHWNETLPFKTPSLFIKLNNGHLCSPNKFGAERFYSVMDSAKWMVNFTNYGHGDQLNDQSRFEARLMCGGCKENCDFPEFRSELSTVITSFVKGLAYKDASEFNVLENASSIFSLNIVNYYELFGFDHSGGGFCENV